MNLLIFLASLTVVTLGAEMLVRGSSTLALRAGLSPLFVGLTIVGAGTSTPELFASLNATLRGSDGVAVGNVVGSNVFNVGVILGLCALLTPIVVRLREIRRDLCVAIGASMVPWLAWCLGGSIPRPLGFTLVAGLAVYLVLTYRLARRASDRESITAADIDRALSHPPRVRFLERSLTLFVMAGIGLGALWFGSRLFIGSAVDLLSSWGVSEVVVGVTVVSAGTSLPELVTSLVAARRGQVDLAIGNVLGSSIFNVLGILGVCAAVRPQAVDPAVLVLHTPAMVLFTLALLPIVRTGGRVSRVEGVLLLAGYVAYLLVTLRVS